MPNGVNENIEFVRSARDALSAIKESDAKLKDRGAAVKRLEKALATERKNLQNDIADQVERHRTDVTKSYDDGLADIAKHKKRIEGQRNRARDKAIRDRVAGETAALAQENASIKKNTDNLYREHDVPKFADSGLFYALFMPKGAIEILIAFIALVVCFAAIPLIIYFAVGQPGVFILVLIFIIDIVVFGAIYILINNKVKMGHLDAVRQGRANRNLIKENNKKIKGIRKGIETDRNESTYGLEEFDRQLQSLENDRVKIEGQKNSALEHFESVDRPRIVEEINAAYAGRIAKANEDLENAKNDLEKMRSENNSMTDKTISTYESRLGREFMNVGKLDKMIDAFSVEGVVTIADAQEYVRSGRVRYANGEPLVKPQKQEDERRNDSL